MTIYEKIAKIQDEVEVRKSADNPFFHSKYATYEGVLNAIHDAMRKYNLVAMHSFEPSTKENCVVVITEIRDLDTPADYWGSKLEIPLLKNDPQSAGSAITYAKRYSLLAILGLGTEDDDGNSSSGKTVTSQPTATTYPDTRVQEATGGVIYATDPQINAINKGIKEGKLGPEIAKEIPTMSKVRASQLISKMYGN